MQEQKECESTAMIRYQKIQKNNKNNAWKNIIVFN